jgi:alkylation response protein AidB-like acyl-CoA dehydrogenase
LVDWWRILNSKGWGVSHWPKEYGGTGWTSVQHYIFNEELQMAPAPAPLAFGVSMVGPVIYTFGNEAQKKHYLPRIASVGPGPSARATNISSTARRPGPRWPNMPTGSFACAAPIPRPRSSPAFRSS